MAVSSFMSAPRVSAGDGYGDQPSRPRRLPAGRVPHEALRWLRAHAPVFWHADGGAPEFVRDIAAPLPLYVICELMGAQVADRMRLLALSSRLAGFDDPDFRTRPGERAMTAGAEMCTYARELAVQRREQPRGDIIT